MSETPQSDLPEIHPYLEQYPDATQDVEMAHAQANASTEQETELVRVKASVRENIGKIGLLGNTASEETAVLNEASLLTNDAEELRETANNKQDRANDNYKRAKNFSERLNKL